MRAAGSGIPGRSADDVRQHDEWYSEYLMLKDSKKKAIQEWKQGKEVCFRYQFSMSVEPVKAVTLGEWPSDRFMQVVQNTRQTQNR